MSRAINRRDFLRASAMAAATAAAAGTAGLAMAGQPADGETDLAGTTWNKAPCRFCGTGCHVKVGVRGGRVVGIAGDELADVNKGLLCVKGYHVGLIPYGSDRLTTPLLRKQGRLDPVSWDVALDVLADRVMKEPGDLPSMAVVSGRSRRDTRPRS